VERAHDLESVTHTFVERGDVVMTADRTHGIVLFVHFPHGNLIGRKHHAHSPPEGKIFDRRHLHQSF
jgi:hypothetical protein